MSEPRWGNEDVHMGVTYAANLKPRVRWDSQRTESQEGKEGIEKGHREGE